MEARHAGNPLPRARGHRPRIQPLSLLAAPRRAPQRPGQRLFRGLGRRAGRVHGLARRPSVLHRRGRRSRRLGRLLRRRVRRARPDRAPGRSRGRAGRGPPRRLRPARQAGQSGARQSLEPRGLVQLVPLLREARLAGRPRERRGRGAGPRSAALRRLPGRRRLRDRDRRLDDGQARVSGPRRPGPGHHGQGLSGRHLDGPVQRGGVVPPLRRASRLDGRGGREAQALLPGLGPDDLRPRHHPSGGQSVAGRDLRGATEGGIRLPQDRLPVRGRHVRNATEARDPDPSLSRRDACYPEGRRGRLRPRLRGSPPALGRARRRDAHRRGHGALLEDQAVALPGPERLFRAQERPDAPIHAPGFLAQRPGLPAAERPGDRAHAERTGALRPLRRRPRQPGHRQRQAGPPGTGGEGALPAGPGPAGRTEPGPRASRGIRAGRLSHRLEGRPGREDEDRRQPIRPGSRHRGEWPSSPGRVPSWGKKKAPLC